MQHAARHQGLTPEMTDGGMSLCSTIAPGIARHHPAASRSPTAGTATASRKTCRRARHDEPGLATLLTTISTERGLA
jgi:hypothetical protein